MFSYPSLIEICEKIIDCPHSTPKWTNDGVLVIRNHNVRNGNLDLTSVSYTDEINYLKRSKRITLREGDIIITREAPMGEVCMIPPNTKCCLGQRVVAIRVNNKKCDSNFLLYSLRSKFVQNQIAHSEGTGSTVSNLRIPLLEQIKIKLPKQKIIQTKISNVLKNIDDKININKRKIKIIDNISVKIFQSWFVKFEPVFELQDKYDYKYPKDFINTEKGKIPKGWEIVNLRELFDIQGGSQPPADQFEDVPSQNSIRLLQIRDFETDGHKTYIQKTNKLKIVNDDDVLVGRYGSGSGVFMKDSLGRPLRGLNGAINVAIARIIPNEKNIKEYAYNLILSGEFYKLILQGSERAVQSGFKKEDLDLIKVIKPDAKILEIFESISFQLWSKKKKLKKLNQKLEKIKEFSSFKLFDKLEEFEIKKDL